MIWEFRCYVRNGTVRVVGAMTLSEWDRYDMTVQSLGVRAGQSCIKSNIEPMAFCTSITILHSFQISLIQWVSSNHWVSRSCSRQTLMLLCRRRVLQYHWRRLTTFCHQSQLRGSLAATNSSRFSMTESSPLSLSYQMLRTWHYSLQRMMCGKRVFLRVCTAGDKKTSS